MPSEREWIESWQAQMIERHGRDHPWVIRYVLRDWTDIAADAREDRIAWHKQLTEGGES